MPTALITGANRGIGLELARLLRDRGYQVIATCRTSSEDLDSLGVRVETGLDVTDATSVDRLAKSLSGVTLDLLVNNAGLLLRDFLGELDFEDIHAQLAVNTLGPLRLTEALLPRLSDGARVVFITSRMGSIEDNTSGGMYGYRMSKAALNMAAKSLALDLRPRNVAVGILHPGYVRTGMTGGQGLVDPPEAAAQLVARIEELGPQSSGTFRHANGDALPW